MSIDDERVSAGSSTSVTRWFGALPGLREARVMSLFALVAGMILCGVSLWYGFRGELFMGRPMGGDFVQYYAAGKIAAPAVYDRSYLSTVEHAEIPEWSRQQMLSYGYPPWFVQLLRPFALLPYRAAYCAWLLISLAIFAASVALLFPVAGLAGRERSTAILLAISAAPFLFETWIGGQVPIVGFLSIALLLRLRHDGRPFAAGLAFAICTYKPSLVAIPALMLIIAGEWTVLTGFALGTAALLGVSLATFGWAGIAGWIETMQYVAELATGTLNAQRRFKQVDVNNFVYLLFGASIWTRILAGIASLLLIAKIALATWHLRTASAIQRNAIFAAALTATLVAGVYTPIYDIALLPAAVLLAWPLVRTLPLVPRQKFQVFVVGLYLVPWLTQSFAEFLHLQLLTPLLVAFALWLCAQASAMPEPLLAPADASS